MVEQVEKPYDQRLLAVRLWDFMGFADSGWIELRPATLLFGRNGAGKSAILRALLLLKQSMTSPASGEALTLYARDGIDVGSFYDILHRKSNARDRQPEREDNRWIGVGFGFKCRVSPELLEIFLPEGERQQAQAAGRSPLREEEQWATLRLDFGPQLGTERITLQGIELGAEWLDSRDQKTLIFSAEWLESEWISGRWQPRTELLKQYLDEAIEDPWKDFQGFDTGMGFLPVLPETQDDGSTDDQFVGDYQVVRGLLDEFRQSVSGFLQSLHYLGPTRGQPPRFHYAPGAMTSPETVRGSRTLGDWLGIWGTTQWEAELGQVNARLAELKLGIQLQVDALDEGRKPYQSIFEVSIVEDEGVTASLSDTGFGWSQVLPIVLECALARDGTTILIEQPELHLHPEAQVRLAYLFARAASLGIGFVLETHSHHFLLGFRRCIAHTRLQDLIQANDADATGLPGEDVPRMTSDQLVIHLVVRQHGASILLPIEITEHGRYVDRPDEFVTFFSDDYNQATQVYQDISRIERLEFQE